MKLYNCLECSIEYTLTPKKPGPIDVCADCGDELETVHKYTGNMIYDHKVGASIQINSDPALTAYINNATKLRNKGSNLGNNLKINSNKVKSNGLAYSCGGRSRRRE
jgi:DNA-directed RNA polymerase subunit RPC12/RpoP